MDKNSHSQKPTSADAAIDAIFASLPGFAFEFLPDGKFLRWNRGYRTLLGWTDEQMARMTAFDTIAAEDRERIRTALPRIPAGQEFTVRLTVLGRDGRTLPVNVTGVKIEVDGAPRIFGVGTDLSALVAVEDALSRSEQNYREIFDSTSEGLFIHDVEGRIVDVNARTCEMFDLPRDAMIGEFPIRFTAEDETFTSEEARARVRLALEKGPQLFEWHCRRAGGEDFWVEVALRAAQIAERPRVIAAVREITERKRAERERAELEEHLRHAQKMESIGRLAGGVAHDFNNLLTAITGYLSLIELTDCLDPKTREQLDEIGKAADSAANLTRQLLAFSRKQVVAPRVIEVNDTVRRLEKMLARLLGDNVEMLSRLAPDTGRTFIDEGQLEQILVNLAVNARDAMPDGGHLVIETAAVLWGDEHRRAHPDMPPGPYVRISVSDDGAGMSAEVKARLFEPFFTTKEMGRGTGLGLFIVYGAVQQNGGAIDVCSEVGLGTSIHVYLPNCDARAERSLSRNDGALRGGDECILVVEDADAVREMAARALSRLGYRVQSFLGAKEALPAIESPDLRIDLLLTDISMPGMNGLELASRARAVRPGLRVLFTSGFSADSTAHGGPHPDGIEFLAKPYRAETLGRRVREILDAK